MVDSSSSVGSTNFQKLEHFLKDVVAKIDVAPNKVQVGIVKYGSYPSIEFPLGAYKTRPEVIRIIIKNGSYYPVKYVPVFSVSD